jgi:hypothetical protein
MDFRNFSQAAVFPKETEKNVKLQKFRALYFVQYRTMY